MVPKKWYTVEIQMVENLRGNFSLLFQGYKYVKAVDTSNGTSYWRCPKRTLGCRARVAMRGHNQLKIGLDYHNHPPICSGFKQLLPLPVIQNFGEVQHNPVKIEDIVKLESCDL